MKQKAIFISLLLLSVCSAFTLIKVWKVDNENSKINFELPVHGKKGTFQNLKAVIDFDENNLQNSKISATIDVKTIKIGNDKQEAHLRSPDFFDAERFPIVSFVSNEIIKIENGYLAKGKLTMKDSIKPVEIPFTYTEETKTKALFNGTMTINAAEFGVLKAVKPGADRVIIYLIVPVYE